MPFKFYDTFSSYTSQFVAYELNHKDEYNFDNIGLKPGDIVIDIGGNIGMVSILLARKFPFIKVYAFEPVKQNYENFLRNIDLNRIPEGVIAVENIAVTKDSRDVCMKLIQHNPGGSMVSSDAPQNGDEAVRSETLMRIIEKNKIGKVKLLKIDCEGTEYEILYNAPPQILSNIEYLRGEFHTLPDNTKPDNSPERLLEYCGKYFEAEKIAVLLI
jgi:FkbM family methyltransferase